MLLNAVSREKLEMVKEMIKRGADVNSSIFDGDGNEYKGGLLLIAERLDPEVLKELIKAGAKVDDETRKRFNAVAK